VRQHRGLAGSGRVDPQVGDPGNGWIGSQGTQHRPVRQEIMSAGSEDHRELVILAEPGRMRGRVGHAGREGERGDHPEDAADRAEQRRPGRDRVRAAARLEREPHADHRRRGQPGPNTSQSALIPGFGSFVAATPNGIHRDATIASTTPAPAPATAAATGPTAATAVPWDRVSPRAVARRNSPAEAATSRAIACPPSTSPARNTASAKASRQALSKPVTLR
jgi:hypothetical protein